MLSQAEISAIAAEVVKQLGPMLNGVFPAVPVVNEVGAIRTMQLRAMARDDIQAALERKAQRKERRK